VSTTERRRAGRSAGPTTKNVAAKRKSAPSKNQGHVCSEPGCGKVCRTPAGLRSHQRQAHPAPPAKETPTAAVERALRSITVTPKLAVLAATVRELAVALEQCEPTDKAKTSKELTARMNDLLGDGPADDGPDWTEDEES
jgi:hypothetical protein